MLVRISRQQTGWTKSSLSLLSRFSAATTKQTSSTGVVAGGLSILRTMDRTRRTGSNTTTTRPSPMVVVVLSRTFSSWVTTRNGSMGVPPRQPNNNCGTTMPTTATTTWYPCRWFTSQAASPHRPRRSRVDDHQNKEPHVANKKRQQPATAAGIAVVRKAKNKAGYCYGCGADIVASTSTSTTTSTSSSTTTSSDNGDNGQDRKRLGSVGVTMQTVTKKSGYWQQKQDELKKSQIKNWALCPRCKHLQKIGDDYATRATFDLLTALGPDSEMMAVFRQEVSKIRTKERAVVVLCVDAVNISGSLIKTIRNYVGGNPILLAVTRCDLLPRYVWDRYQNDLDQLKTVFRQRAADIMPAAVYLCSEQAEYRQSTGGLQELTNDLWQHLNGRDPYIVGAANIGKSTLTDILIARLALRGEKRGDFSDHLGQKRLGALRRSRITKSSLPGTTLQNVRVPCFDDHCQALWDTPGLLLDESLAHFPIRKLRAIRAQRPSQIVPQIIETDRKAFALLICEKDQDIDLPLMRIEVRLKKSAKGEGPVRLVWNSTIDLKTKIVDIAEAMQDEGKRTKQVQEEREQLQKAERQHLAELEQLSMEERERRKEQRKKEHQERIEKEKRELGELEWKRLERNKREELENQKRFRDLAQLFEVHQVVLERNVGTDLAIANFGWLGMLVPRTTLIKTYAPSTGVRVSHHPTLALPTEWGEYTLQAPTNKETAKVFDDDSDSDSDEDELGFDDWDDEDNVMMWGDSDDMFSDYSSLEAWEADPLARPDYSSLEAWEADPLARPDKFGFSQGSDDDQQNDVWKKYSGENVGWRYDPDVRFLKGERKEGWNPIYQANTDDDKS